MATHSQKPIHTRIADDHEQLSWLCIRFSHFALNLLKSSSLDSSKAKVISDGEYVWQFNAAAANMGVSAGMSINQMQLLTRLQNHSPRDKQLERLRLAELAEWATQFTPDVTIYSEDTLLLEIGRSLSLFGTVDTITHKAFKQLTEMGFDLRMGLARTPKAAYLLSLGNIDQPVNSGTHALLATPLHLLQVSPKSIVELERCGFAFLGDLSDIPHSELGNRFGRDFTRYLDQLYGNLPDPQQAIKLPPRFNTQTSFAQPISNSTWIAEHQLNMIKELVDFAQARNLIYQHMQWKLWLEEDKHVISANIELNAKGLIQLSDEAQSKALYELVKLKFDTLELNSQITQIELSCIAFAPKSLYSQDLFSDDTHDQEFEDLKNKLAARLGHRAIRQLDSKPEIIPEDSYAFVTQSSATMHVSESLDEQYAEPTWLFEKPKPLSVKNGRPQYRGDLEFIHGANRVVTQWWAKLKSRDYYIARQENGQVVWVYFDRVSKKWFLHGLFG